MAAWRENIELIQNDESVTEQVPNRPLQQLADRTQYLKDRLDISSVGEGLVLGSQPVESAAVVGDAVYYNTTDNEYKRALATADEDSAGVLTTDEQAYVVGVLVTKLSSVTGDILIQGRSTGLSIKDANGTALTEGTWYLSGADKGKLVSARPSVGIFVATVTNQGVIVNPTPREVLEDHIHYRFGLLADPSGTPICNNSDRVSIEYADNTVEGWLPADDPIFDNTPAPAGAQFGYNWSASSRLAAVWPPQPLGSAYVEHNGVGVAPEHVRVDDNGIWWMTNCNADVPWDAEECVSSSVALVEQSSSSNYSAAAYVPCTDTARRITLYFTRMVSKTDASAVTGLKTASGSPVVVSGCTPDASGYCQGKLELDLNMPWDRTANTGGSEVVKTISDHGDLGVGHVVEGLRGAGLITLSGSQLLSSGHSAGLVTVTGVDPTAVTRTLDVSLVALAGATESIYSDVLPYVGLPSGRASSFIGKVRVPRLSMTLPRIHLDLWFATPTTGTPPANVSVCYAVVEAAESTADSSSSLAAVGGFSLLPTAFSASVDLSLEDLGLLSAGEYFQRRVLDALSVASDELLLFCIQRSASDGYAGELAVVNMVATVYDAG